MSAASIAEYSSVCTVVGAGNAGSTAPRQRIEMVCPCQRILRSVVDRVAAPCRRVGPNDAVFEQVLGATPWSTPSTSPLSRPSAPPTTMVRRSWGLEA
jgi:hypothetical protein